MKVSVKTLANEQFEVDLEAEDTVSKAQRPAPRGHDARAWPPHEAPPPLAPPPTAQGLVAKQKISTARGAGFDPALQKLIHAGKVLKDEETLGSSGVKEGSFLVCMVSKPKAVSRSCGRGLCVGTGWSCGRGGRAWARAGLTAHARTRLTHPCTPHARPAACCRGACACACRRCGACLCALKRRADACARCHARRRAARRRAAGRRAARREQPLRWPRV